MKTIIRVLSWIGLVTCLNPACRAAGILIDSFGEGSFSLSADGARNGQSEIKGTIVNYRRVSGSGLGDWRALLVPGSGFLEYDVREIVPAGRPFALYLSYSNSGGGLRLDHHSSFLLDFAMISGSAMLKVSLASFDGSVEVELPITTAGVLEVSFDNVDLGSVFGFTGLAFSIVPDASPFSLRLNEISVVPEPGVTMLTFVGGLGALGRRRR